MKVSTCPVPGCGLRGAPTVIRVHARHDHIVCSCSWVGVSFRQHRSQRIRFRQKAATAETWDAATAEERQAHQIVRRIRRG